MKKVVTLVGLRAGQEMWMNDTEAQAAIDSGTAVWPGDKANVAGADFDTGYADKDDRSKRKEFDIVPSDGLPSLKGKWPKKAIVTQKLMSSNMFHMNSAGEVSVKIGDRAAKYKAVTSPKGGDLYVDFDSEIDLGAPVEASTGIVIPEDWEKMNWMSLGKIAREITGEKTRYKKAEAVEIITAHLAG